MNQATDLTNWICYTLESYTVEKCPITGLIEATIRYFDKSGAQYVCTYIVDYESPRFELRVGGKVVKV